MVARLLRSAAVVGLAALAAGCTTVVAGTVRPAPGLVPGPLTGSSVKRVLLDDADLSKMLDEKFRSDPNLPPRFGGVSDLPDGWASGTPAECIGTLVGNQGSVYDALAVQDIAQEFWAGPDDAPVTAVVEGVLALPAAGDAEAAFEDFAAQWSRCDGVTVTRTRDGQVESSGAISDVQTGDSMLTAVVETSGGADVLPMRIVRALGVRLNCLIDVDVFLSEEGGSSSEAHATDIARAMMAKVSELAP